MDIDKVVVKVLDILRTQRDSKGVTELTGSIPVDPSSFRKTSSSDNSYKHKVIGPVTFQTVYSSPPTVSLTQYSDIITKDVRSSDPGQGSNYTPFLVHPYVYNWRWSNGVVDGFYIGLYALTDPVESPRASQIVWRSTGTATRYLNPNMTEKWTREDNSYTPHYLHEDATTSQNYEII